MKMVDISIDHDNKIIIRHPIFPGSHSGLVAGDAMEDHNDDFCGRLGCKPVDQGPAGSGGGIGSSDDITSGVNQPSQTDNDDHSSSHHEGENTFTIFLFVTTAETL